jgi:murein DD-endopeptidase MepM/ murein hydrolase activator NlpD
LLVADRFDFPLGTAEERDSGFMPPGIWQDSNPFMNYYYLGPGKTNPAYHSGADLLIEPGGGCGQGVYACANGVITFAQRIPNSSWGNLIVQACTLPDGSVVYIRYAHTDPMLVKSGQEVVRGQQIAVESNAFGRFPCHLHLDISPTTVLRDHPADWPGMNRAYLEKHYVAPLVFISKNREVITLATLEELKAVRAQAQAVVTSLDKLIGTPAFEPNYFTKAWLKVRAAPVNGDVVTVLAPNTGVLVVEAESVAGWKKISQPNVGFCSEVYLTPKA